MTEAAQMTFWPPPLQKHRVSATRLRIRPRRMIRWGGVLLTVAACFVILSFIALFMQEWPESALFALLSLPLCIPLGYRWRWCDIEYVPGGWCVATGFSRWSVSEVRFGARSLQTWCIDRLLHSPVGRLPEDRPCPTFPEAGYHVLRLEFVTLPFAGDPEPLILGDGAVLPRDELEALGQVFERMATGNPPLYPLEVGALADARAGSPAPRSRA